MKHYGDITKIKGYEVPIVDIVTGGSPCQDLSVAGKRAGLDGERSGLFMEQIRIIKEMREHDKASRGADVDFRLLRPRFMVWENVPGAFSSNKGEDFRCVLEETARIVDKDAVIPRLEGKQKWTPSGCIMGDGWSIAWRVHDAQFWGVPQRRKRIALVADFGGQTAPEILFERESLSGNLESSKSERKEVARTIGESTNPSSYTLKIRGGCEVDSKGKKAGKGALIQTELSGTLGVSQDQTLIQTNGVVSKGNGDCFLTEEKHMSLSVGGGQAGQGYPCVMTEEKSLNQGINGDVAGTLDASYYKGCGERQGIEREVVAQSVNEQDSVDVGNIDGKDGENPEAVCVGNGQMCNITMKPIANSLDTMHDQQAVLTYGIDAHNIGSNEETSQTLLAGRNDTHNIPCVAYGLDAYNQSCTGEKTMPITGAATDSHHIPCVAYGVDSYNQTAQEEIAEPLRSAEGGDTKPKVCVYGIDRASFNQGKNAQFNFSVEEEKAQTIVSRGPGGVLTQ